jgi:hypothetical protein
MWWFVVKRVHNDDYIEPPAESDKAWIAQLENSDDEEEPSCSLTRSAAWKEKE